MKLPNGKDAIVEMSKLTDYCLNEFHTHGGHKAEVFRKVLGLTRENAPELRSALLAAAAEEEATRAGEDDFGWHFVIDFEISRNGRQAWVRSGWTIRPGEMRPRLTTCFIRRKR